jgi:hypothetical protein
MTAKAYRYYVRSPDGRVAFGFDRDTAANAVAIEHGPGARDGSGRSALQVAELRGRPEIAELLRHRAARGRPSRGRPS